MKMLAREPYSQSPSGSIPRVGITKGFPSIIPLNLRPLLLTDWLVMKVVLSIVCVYRVIGFKSEIDLSSIITPFNGMSRLLPYVEVSYVMSLLITTFNITLPSVMRVNLFRSFTSGPNFRPSMAGLPLDALAILLRPTLLFSMLSLAIRMQGGAILL
jgi:hypothetical protein